MDITEKCAAICHKLTPDDGRWAEAAEDITDIMGEKAASVISAVEQYFKNAHHSYDTYDDFSKRAFTRNLAYDRHGVIGLATDIAELQDILEKAAHQVAQLLPPQQVAALNQLAAQLPPTPAGNPAAAGANTVAPTPTAAPAPTVNADEDLPKGKKEEADLPIKPVEDLSALLEAMTGSVKGITQEDVMNTKPVKELDALLQYLGPKKDTRSKILDKALLQAQMDTTLQQLMLTDDVISEADPEEVQALFKTLADISPSLATDPGKMGPALKEALQYGSVPINILSDVSKLEGQILKNDLTRSAVEKDKYSL